MSIFQWYKTGKGLWLNTFCVTMMAYHHWLLRINGPPVNLLTSSQVNLQDTNHCSESNLLGINVTDVGKI